MKTEEAKDILSDMRDQHLCFLGDSEIKEEWQKKYLKEAWACDSCAKALTGLITGIKIDKGIIAESILHYGKKQSEHRLHGRMCRAYTGNQQGKAWKNQP